MGDIVYALSSRNCEQKKEGLNKASNVPNKFVCFKYDKIHCVWNFKFFSIPCIFTNWIGLYETLLPMLEKLSSLFFAVQLRVDFVEYKNKRVEIERVENEMFKEVLSLFKVGDKSVKSGKATVQ